jgi:hypothetical protein
MVFSRCRLVLALLACLPALASAFDHQEFSAELQAPYRGTAAPAKGLADARTFTLTFEFPSPPARQKVEWRLELRDPGDAIVQQWQGVEPLPGEVVTVEVAWDGRLNGSLPKPGIYHVILSAWASDLADASGAAPAGTASTGSTLGTAHASSKANPASTPASEPELVEQRWDISVGPLARIALPFASSLATPRSRSALQMAPATGALPYTVWLGNLHSQTGHSDGGGDLANCHGAQNPQSSPLGPTEAYDYARQHGLDVLVTSEHNHMYDGSDGANPDADPVFARALYQRGLAAAASFNVSHPDFIAVYATEWGVINNGGHMNIFNSPELLGWERNKDGQLIGDRFTPKGDYAGLYSLMRAQGWIGQFNHPASSGQFAVNGVPFGYTEDGDQAMALCEVVNSSAFSTNTTETETRRSNFEGACNKALEAGYHVAFSSNQDNHCANWGVSFSNRTGVLLPRGAAPGSASLIDALRARRVFATMDKGSQLVLTANGHLMGERFDNVGRVTLAALYASSAGKTVASVQIMEGVPGRNGTVSMLSDMATITILPTPGPHFYYARVTQTDGNILWSAPVWINQLAASQQPLKIPVRRRRPAR